VNISVSIDRTELALAALVITNDPYAGDFHIPEDGITEPEFPMRVAYAPESVYMPGKLPLAAAVDAGGLALIIYAHAASSAALTTAKAVLAAALGQWRFDITTDVDGEQITYESICPAVPSWGQVDSGMVAAHMARCSVTIPVNPPS
jgi:hypothetical protein